MVPRRANALVRHLAPPVLEALIGSLASATPRDRRDRAMILLVARLGLRASEVARLRLEDIDWDAALVRVLSRKSGHGAVLPLTEQVGAAIASYLRDGRPATGVREVFVMHWLTVGAPINASLVSHAVARALSQAGIDAPAHGANLMRHSLATSLLAHGTGLADIAQVMGHRSLTTTRIYAAVDTAALAQVPLPWPQPSPATSTIPPRSSRSGRVPS
jgi:site-specific recombinase XerD